jgi:lambda family phage portal protein
MIATADKPHIKLKAADLWPNIKAASDTSHDAASRSDRAMSSWNPTPLSADADLIPELPAIMPRARDLVRNNALASGVQQTLKDNIVGGVLRLNAKPDTHLLGWDRDRARDWSRTTESRFRTWADTPECDAGRSMGLLGLTIQLLGGAIVNGDALAIPVWRPRAGSPWATRIMAIEADRLSTPADMQHRADIRGGVEINRDGAPVAYWIRRTHPGDVLNLSDSGSDHSSNYRRIPAFTRWGRRRVIHLHDRERSGQNRGKSIFAAVMREFHLTGKYQSAELNATVANSMVAGFIESSLDPQSLADMFGSGGDGEAYTDHYNTSLKEYQPRLKEAALIPMPPGTKVNSFIPGRPNSAFKAFMETVLRHIAAGMNMPYELLTKDFSQTNYSSARAALLEAWRYFLGRRKWLINHWLQPVYELWLEEAINNGLVEAPDYYANRYAYTRSRWTFAGRGWVDPVKEANAARIRIEMGLSTYEIECAEQGLDFEEVFEQRGYEKQLMDAAGFVPGDTAAIIAAQAQADKDDQEQAA